jgi:hypothetical protein
MVGGPFAAYDYFNDNLEVYFDNGGRLGEYYHTTAGWSGLGEIESTVS